jgi:predicted ferric reductase
MMPPVARAACWTLAFAIAFVPLGIAAASPLQASRDLMWVVGGMAGVAGLSLLFLQPFLMAGLSPSSPSPRARRWHRWVGLSIVLLVLLHVLGLYLTSPEDITDALLLVSPTPFAVYGVLGLVGVVLTACLAAIRKALPRRTWQIAHSILAAVIVVGSIVHALMIEGVMGDTSKLVLCVFLALATIAAIIRTASRVRKGGKTLGK